MPMQIKFSRTVSVGFVSVQELVPDACEGKMSDLDLYHVDPNLGPYQRLYPDPFFGLGSDPDLLSNEIGIPLAINTTNILVPQYCM